MTKTILLSTLCKGQIRYRFLNDPGHGWLEVPRAELEALGIADKISSYSYINQRFAYLEEDCDAPKFLAAKWPGKSFMTLEAENKIIDVYQEYTPIRNYANYPGQD